jgi:hypothetical protein
MGRVGPNERCPCGSGKKYKKCCQAKDELRAGFTRGERASALAKLDEWVGNVLGAEDDQAYEELAGNYLEGEEDLPEPWTQEGEAIQNMWMFFDRPLADGRLVVDRFLEEGPALSASERLFLETVRRSSMHLYEIEDLVPGQSLSLRDVLEGDRVTVREQAGSRTMNRHEWIAARITPSGASGQPEIEMGIVPITPFLRNGVLARLTEERARVLKDPETSVEDFYKMLGPVLLHDVLVAQVLHPPIPQLANTDGEPMLWTKVRFEAADPQQLSAALDTLEGLERADEEGASVWSWSGRNKDGKPVSLGRLELRGASLTLEANSAERATRGRAILEALSGAGLRHVATTHVDPEHSLRRAIRDPEASQKAAVQSSSLPPEMNEALVLGFQAAHYRSWLDEPIPALEGKTPRQAVQDPALKPRLITLLHGLEEMYERALKDGVPAYDSSWMWSELGLEEGAAPSHPPPLAHERAYELFPGSGDLLRSFAEGLRRAPGFDEKSSLASPEALNTNLPLQRFLKELPEKLADMSAEARSARIAAFDGLMPWLASFELHRRKAFWVDESLSYMLGHTDLDLFGRELRVAFPCFALVFTDRHVLGLAERLLSQQRTSLQAGQILKVATVLVTEAERASGRVLRLGFAFDAVGADPPQLIEEEIALDEDGKVEAQLDARFPGVQVLAKPWRPTNKKLFSKAAFKVNMRDRTVTCPGGQTQQFEVGTCIEFDSEVCDHCPLRAQCTSAEPGQGRSLSIAENEQLQHRLRKLLKTAAGREYLRERTGIKHRLAHISQRQGRRARYKGTRKNEFDLRRAASIQNLETLHRRIEPLRKAA